MCCLLCNIHHLTIYITSNVTSCASPATTCYLAYVIYLRTLQLIHKSMYINYILKFTLFLFYFRCQKSVRAQWVRFCPWWWTTSNTNVNQPTCQSVTNHRMCHQCPSPDSPWILSPCYRTVIHRRWESTRPVTYPTLQLLWPNLKGGNQNLNMPLGDWIIV